MSGREVENRSIYEICLMIYEILQYKYPQENTVVILDRERERETDCLVEKILSELDRLHHEFETGSDLFKCALTDMKGAVISLVSSIDTTEQFFCNVQEKAVESLDSNTLPGQIIATRMRIICTLFLNHYFDSKRNMTAINEQCSIIFRDFLRITEIKETILVEFENHPIETIWRKIFEPNQTEASYKILHEVGLLQNILHSYTFRDYTITTNEGKLVQFNFAILSGHTGPVNATAIVENILFSGSSDMTIKVWDLNNFTEITTLTGHNAAIIGLIYSDERLYSIDLNGYLKIWDTEILTEIFSMRIRKRPIRCFTLSSDRIYFGFSDGLLMVFDSETLNEISSFQAHSTPINSMLIYENKLISCGSIIKIWDASAPHHLLGKLRGHDHAVTYMTLWDKKLYTASRSIRIWDLNTFQLVGECKKHSHDIHGLVIAGERLYSAGHVIKVWDLHTQQLLQTLKGYSNSIHTLTIYGDEIYTSSEHHNVIQVRHLSS